MLTFAKRQHAIENGMSIEHVHDEVEKSLLDDALKFTNMGQHDLVPYDPSDIDEDIEYEESDKLLEEPEEDDMGFLETFFLKTENCSNRYSQLKVWASFLKKI